MGNYQNIQPTFCQCSLYLDRTVLEANMDALPNYASDNFRDKDRYTLEIEMETVLGLMLTSLISKS